MTHHAPGVFNGGDVANGVEEAKSYADAAIAAAALSGAKVAALGNYSSKGAGITGIVRNGTGDYTVLFAGDDGTYTVAVSLISAVGGIMWSPIGDGTGFNVSTFNLAGAAADAAWSMIILPGLV